MHRVLPVYRADPDGYDLSSIRRMWHVGAPCPPVDQGSWIELVGPDALWEMYGGTELQAIAVLSGTEWLAHRGSVGRVVAGEMKVLDDDGNECAPGEIGEVYMRPVAGSAAPTATSGPPRRPTTAGTRWAISATSTRTATCICPTGASTCSPWAARTPIRPKSRTRCAGIRMCCPAWWSGCRTRTSVRCRTRWCRPTGRPRRRRGAGVPAGAAGNPQGAAHRGVRRAPVA